MRRPILLLSAFLLAAGCSSGGDEAESAGSAQEIASAAKVTFSANFETKISGTVTAGRPLVIDYALERLTQCRGNVGGGGPGWNIGGFYSENGGEPKAFEVTTVSEDGLDRVAKSAKITPSTGGDLAIWFQNTSRWGCSEYDSQLGQNYHFQVQGAVPESAATITFKQNGDVDRSGDLVAGGKVRVRYEQARLPECRRTERGNPVWTITGFSQIDRETSKSFDTGRPQGSDRVEVDALVDLPHAGQLSLWFQVHSIGGCMEYDSNHGANYTFAIRE